MIDDKALFEIQCNIIGYLLKHKEDIEKLSINENYFKEFGNSNFKYLFKRIKELHKDGRDAELLTDLLEDKNINQDFVFNTVYKSNPYEEIASIQGLEDTIISAYKDRLVRS